MLSVVVRQAISVSLPHSRPIEPQMNGKHHCILSRKLVMWKFNRHHHRTLITTSLTIKRRDVAVVVRQAISVSLPHSRPIEPQMNGKHHCILSRKLVMWKFNRHHHRTLITTSLTIKRRDVAVVVRRAISVSLPHSRLIEPQVNGEQHCISPRKPVVWKIRAHSLRP